MTTDLDRFELARQRLAAPKPVDVPLVTILAEQRDAETMVRQTEFVPPADSAINVNDIEAMGSHGFAYHAGAARFTLIAASADGGQVTATWSRGGASGFARALTARLAIREALATFDDLTLRVDVERALLSRKTEYVWRGPITEGRVGHDYAVAVTLNGLGADAAYWAAPGATDWAHGEALFMEFERVQDEASAINVRLDALAVTQDAELARYGVNEADVESLGYWILLEIHADAVRLNIFRSEASRHLSGARLDRAVDEFWTAIERGRAITSLAELDARAAELSPHGGWHRIVAGLGGRLCDRCEHQIETVGGCQELTCICWCRATGMDWYDRTE